MKEKKQVMRKHWEERYNHSDNVGEKPPMPQSLNLEVNNTCNQKCIFCSCHGLRAKCVPKPAVMDYAFARAILEQASSLGIGKKELGFYIGGEPLLYTRIVELIKDAKQMGFPYVYLTTNGALANPEKMSALLDAGLDSIRFSVNAVDDSTYALIHGKDDFRNVVSNIQFMHEYIEKEHLDVATSISCVLTKKTKDIEEKMKVMFGELVDDIVFFPAYFSGLNIDEDFLEEFGIPLEKEEEINDFICPVPFNSMYIDAEGRVLHCCESYGESIPVMDLKDHLDLEKAWNSPEMMRYRVVFLEGASDEGTACRGCHLRRRKTYRSV